MSNIDERSAGMAMKKKSNEQHTYDTTLVLPHARSKTTV